MLRRKRIVQNATISRNMREFFGPWGPMNKHSSPEAVAEAYGRFFWKLWHEERLGALEQRETLTRSRFNISLSVKGAGRFNFGQLTKRTALVSDTLLLSHDRTVPYHALGAQRRSEAASYIGSDGGGIPMFSGGVEPGAAWEIPRFPNSSTTLFGMHCPHLAELGNWILDVKPLLRAGLIWYAPTYSLVHHNKAGKPRPPQPPEWLQTVDLLIKDGRAVEDSGEEPIKSQLVRPVLEVDLPFLEGVDLRTFSQITVEEFAAFTGFRDFLRQAFLNMDEALNSVQSDRELAKLALQIKDQIRGVRTEMGTARRRRALAASGAVVGSVGVFLVAVYGPALAAVVTAMGAGSGVWGMLHAAAEKNPRAIREDKWYYVWALTRKSDINFI